MTDVTGTSVIIERDWRIPEKIWVAYPGITDRSVADEE